MKWSVDSLFAVHPNMRGNSGGVFPLGRGFPIVSYTKQKLNTRSSTEIELVGTNEFMTEIFWIHYVLKAQGYTVMDNVLFQDNRRSIILEKNGKASSRRRTKNMNICHFFITNRFTQGNVALVWCPKGDMIRDFMTKPLQRDLFRKFRDQIMGVIPDQDPGPGNTQPGKAHPGKAHPGKEHPEKGNTKKVKE